MPLIGSLAEITSPVVLPFWQQHLKQHKDKALTDRILNGLQYGFRVGYQRKSGQLQQAKSNMMSARTHGGAVDEYLRQEEEAGRVAVAGLATRRSKQFTDLAEPYWPGLVQRKAE